MNRTFSFTLLLALTWSASGSIHGIAEDRMPMGGHSLMRPQSAAQPQAGTTMPMGQAKPTGMMGGGMGNMMTPMGQPSPKPAGTMGGGMPQVMNMAMAPMSMAGTVSMDGRQYNMKCDMQPVGKAKGMKMSMDAPMEMNGTMTMMGKQYSCSMKLSPKQATPMAQMGKSEQMSDQELKVEFKDADKNKDGYADFNELVIHEAGDRSRAKLHFDDADRNKDKRVTEVEWIRHHKESSLHNSKVGAK